MAQCSTTFNLVLGFGNCLETLFAPDDLFRDAHPVRDVRLVGGFGLFKQFGNFGFQLLLQLTGVVVTERLVFGCVGLYFSAIQAYRP